MVKELKQFSSPRLNFRQYTPGKRIYLAVLSHSQRLSSCDVDCIIQIASSHYMSGLNDKHFLQDVRKNWL